MESRGERTTECQVRVVWTQAEKCGAASTAVQWAENVEESDLCPGGNQLLQDSIKDGF